MVWRDRDTLQIGIDPRRAVALTGMRGAAGLVSLLDGSREHHQVLAAAQDQGISAAAADRIIGLLAAAGVLADFPAGALRGVPDGSRGRLAAELATVSLAYGMADGGARVLARRQSATVRVYGTGPVGSAIASLLAASGVGQVVCTGPAGQPVAGDARPARPPGRRPRRTASPVKSKPAAQPEPASPHPPLRQPASADRTEPASQHTPLPQPAPADQPEKATQHAPPTTQLASADQPGPTTQHAPPTRRRARGQRPDLTVLTGGYPPELPAALVAGRAVHLAACASEAIGVVGPLVVPGETACLSCVDLARTDRDPAWPRILAQLAGPDAHPAACDAALAGAVAAQAAAQALAFLDRAGPGGVVRNGTLELVLPGWQWRRRSWRPDRRCRCTTRSATCLRI